MYPSVWRRRRILLLLIVMTVTVTSMTSAVHSVARLPGKTETGKEIALQGNVVHEVPEFLAEAYGVDSSFVDCKSRSKAG